MRPIIAITTIPQNNKPNPLPTVKVPIICRPHKGYELYHLQEHNIRLSSYSFSCSFSLGEGPSYTK